MDVYYHSVNLNKTEKKTETMPHHCSVVNAKRAVAQKQVEKAISNKDNAFLTKALLSDDPVLFEIAHNRLHTVCNTAMNLA